MSLRQRSLVVIGALVAFVLPVLIALYIARAQEAEVRARHALDLARSALVQVEKTRDQLARASRTLNALSVDRACAPEGLDIMRRIDLESTLLQGVGWVEGEELKCSSFAGNRPYRIGPVDYVTSNRALVRTAVPILGPEPLYVILQYGSAASIIHPDLALSFVDNEPGMGVVAFSWSQKAPIVQRGVVPPGLLTRALGPGAVQRPDGSTMAVVRSSRTDTGALVLLPRRNAAGFAGAAARQLIPAGILSGLIIAALFVLAARNRASMGGMIRQALAGDLFYLSYQPIIALGTGKIVGVEALLRWRRGARGEIPPDIFIPVAEQRGLMNALTERVFELLERDVPQLLSIAPDLEVAVNLAASDLHRGDLEQTIRKFASGVGLAPSRIVVEATERGLLDPDVAAQSLNSLRQSGVRIAIDDFGTGYSSLAYLAVLEVDILKIDKLFIQALGTGSATSQVAQSIIEMARALDLTTIAEGIETAEQEEIVRALGVGQAQGYHYTRPLPVNQMTAYMREHASLATS